MANEFLAVTDGIFTLSETEKKNQFYFYRNDGGVLIGIDNEPMDLYQTYIMHKIASGEIYHVVMNNICFETSDDGKCIRLTIYGIGEEPDKNNDLDENKKSPSFIKRLLDKIFG